MAFETLAMVALVILVAVLGVILGLLLARRTSRSSARGSRLVVETSKILEDLDIGFALVDQNGVVQAAADSIASLGVVTGSRLPDIQLSALAREAHETGDPQECLIPIHSDVASTPIHSQVNAAAIGKDLVALIFEDRNEAEQVASMRRDFLSNVSHELKTPVAAVQLLAEALEQAAGDPVAVRNFAGSLQQESLRLTRLVTDIIELSRIESGERTKSNTVFEIGVAVSAAVDTNALAASRKSIPVTVSGDLTAQVNGDRRMITSAISSLVENAIQYSKPMTKVSVEARESDGLVRISVVDQGVGIAETDLGRVFARFYRADESRSDSGSGLGLSIVKHTAQLHDGMVTVHSQVGIGSTFVMELPAMEDNLADIDAGEEDEN